MKYFFVSSESGNFILSESMRNEYRRNRNVPQNADISASEAMEILDSIKSHSKWEKLPCGFKFALDGTVDGASARIVAQKPEMVDVKMTVCVSNGTRSYSMKADLSGKKLYAECKEPDEDIAYSILRDLIIKEARSKRVDVKLLRFPNDV